MRGVCSEAGQAAGPRVAGEAVAVVRYARAGRERRRLAVAGHLAVARRLPVAGRLPVARGRAVTGRGAADWTRSRESSRHWFAGARSARPGEAALAGKRTGAGERAAGLGTCVTGETAVGVEEPGARERPLGGVRVLRRAWAVTVRRAVSGAAEPSFGRPTGGGRTS